MDSPTLGGQVGNPALTEWNEVSGTWQSVSDLLYRTYKIYTYKCFVERILKEASLHTDMSEETITVNREKLANLQSHADFTNQSLQKTLEWRIPTERSGAVADLLSRVLSETDAEQVSVSRKRLKDIQSRAEYANSKLQKTYDWPQATQRIGHVSDQLQILLGEMDGELEEFEYDCP
mgnify:CR=1 FL=1